MEEEWVTPAKELDYHAQAGLVGILAKTALDGQDKKDFNMLVLSLITHYCKSTNQPSMSSTMIKPLIDALHKDLIRVFSKHLGLKLREETAND